MDSTQLHKRIKAILQSAETLLKELEKEMVEEVENARIASDRASAVEQARREILAEQNPSTFVKPGAVK